jgi:cytochrome c oxidase subunit II
VFGIFIEIRGVARDGIKRAIEMEKLRHFVAASSKALGLSAAFLIVMASGAMASLATPWQLGTQEPVSPVAVRIHEFHDYLLVLITVITLFVLALMVYVCIKFKASSNPSPSRTTHNTLIEILWTAVPVIILVVVAVPSFKTLYYGDRTPNPDMTIKVTANQWYWTYEYPDQEISFDSYMIPEEEIDPATQTYLLSVDNPLVVPVGKKVHILVTSNDVMHSFFLPSAVVQIYGMVGRTNETWMQIDKEGTVYGQCNQICGINHSAMPIAVTALSQEKYDAWVTEAKVKFAAAPAQIRVADGAVNK